MLLQALPTRPTHRTPQTPRCELSHLIGQPVLVGCLRRRLGRGIAHARPSSLALQVALLPTSEQHYFWVPAEALLANQRAQLEREANVGPWADIPMLPVLDMRRPPPQSLSFLDRLTVDTRGHKLRTPLVVAIYAGSLPWVRVLLAAGADTEKRMFWHVPGGGLTPLHIAAARGDVEVIRELILAGADINAVAHYHITPLHIAGRFGHLAAVKALLLANGADLEVLDTFARGRGYDFGQPHLAGNGRLTWPLGGSVDPGLESLAEYLFSWPYISRRGRLAPSLPEPFQSNIIGAILFNSDGTRAPVESFTPELVRWVL
jgi:hypothetical protein